MPASLTLGLTSSPARQSLNAALRRRATLLGLFLASFAVSAVLLHALFGAGHLWRFVVVDSTGSAASDEVRPDPATLKAERLNRRFDCSHTGLAPGVIPAHTVVEVRGHVRLASFEDGWAMFEGHRPGTLISVCAR